MDENNPKPSELEFTPDHDQCFLALMQLLPRGRAWSRGSNEVGINRDTVQKQFVSGVALSWQHFEQAMVAATDEWFCAHASVDKDLWLLDYGVPDECDMYNADPCAKVAAGKTPTAEYLLALLEASGYNGAGRWLTGDDPEFPGVRSTFYMEVDPAISPALGEKTDLPWTLGAGIRLGEASTDALQCMLERYLPAHCVAVVTVEGITEPVLSGPGASATGQTTATLSVSTNVGNGVLYWVVTNSATAPTQAQVKAGNNHLGTAAIQSGSQTVSSVGGKTVLVTGLTADTTYYAHFMQEDATALQSDVVSSGAFTTFVVAAVLSSPTGVATGQTTATISVTTNTGTGVLYWVTTTSATAPSAEQVRLGQDHLGMPAPDAGSQPVTATGVQTVTGAVDALNAATTYYAHFMQEV